MRNAWLIIDTSAFRNDSGSWPAHLRYCWRKQIFAPDTFPGEFWTFPWLCSFSTYASRVWIQINYHSESKTWQCIKWIWPKLHSSLLQTKDRVQFQQPKCPEAVRHWRHPGSKSASNLSQRPMWGWTNWYKLSIQQKWCPAKPSYPILISSHYQSPYFMAQTKNPTVLGFITPVGHSSQWRLSSRLSIDPQRNHTKDPWD